MKCYTIREKWAMGWQEFKRFVKIITFTVIFAMLLGMSLGVMFTINENKQLKEQITEMEMANSEESNSTESSATYVIEICK